MAGRWVAVGEAARELDISTDAVRKRIVRGSLRSDREDGSVRVWLDDGGTEAGREGQVDRAALIEAKDHAIRILEDQLREEREARRRADTIIAQLTQANAALAQRIPELEAPADSAPEPREAPETATADPVQPTPSEPARDAQEAAQPLSWWRRVFGG